MIISMWQIDPEFRVIEELQSHLEETALSDRKINVKNIVEYGHPLYTLASKGDDSKVNHDSFFPRIGVEWSSDDIEDDLGKNHAQRAMDSRTIAQIKHYMNRDDVKLDGKRGDGDYEHYSYPRFAKVLDGDFKSYQSFTTHVVSEVLISGWGGSGSVGRKRAQTMYKATIDILPFIAFKLSRKFRVNVEYGNSKPSPNVESPTIGNGVWGFEVLLSIRQIKRCYKFSKEPLISKADVALMDSASTGIIFQPLKVENFSPNID
ncbi:hypothetical protein [Leptospira sp. GIMC2001]|uniref:hypothetical protein n=1 Tax=Leptospira sp. GIMC2001 TaxID=1513297 RepID=UPI00234AEEA5|nr:hypothetical protein [Leptospira sp. GIMC2001]WCL51518.1 hypothetical protein O4O04_20085 [Leptospira sp. GIMC2001]